MKVIVKAECVGCAFCKIVCKFDAIDVLYKAEIDEERCVLCMRCINYCPVDALVVK